jgi:hypothetical protein
LTQFIWRTIACQMITYFAIGWLASNLFGYRELFGMQNAHDGSWQYMRSFDSPWIAAGPILQCIRGLLFGLVLWPVRALWLDEPNGWLRIWLLFIGLAILGPTAAAPSSIEGVIYTNLPLSSHLLGLPETCIQTLLFSVLLQRWYRHPRRYWNPLMISSVIIVVGLCTLGILAALHPEAFRR